MMAVLRDSIGTAGQSVRLVTNLYNRSGSAWSYYNHTLHALFIPNQL